jgi:hypothetical protein
VICLKFTEKRRRRGEAGVTNETWLSSDRSIVNMCNLRNYLYASGYLFLRLLTRDPINLEYIGVSKSFLIRFTKRIACYLCS